MFYSPALLSIDAAIAGEGIALAKGKWVQDDLSAGRLVQPFEDILHSEFDYYLVYPKGTTSARVTLFRKWLFEMQGLCVVSKISSTTNSIAHS
jgi:LysR family glycine cleavage system transcriptional activator